VESKVYIDGSRYVLVLKNVYNPAEDTWLTLKCALSVASRASHTHILVDVGSGTGVIGLSLALSSYADRIRYVVATDLNPCATINTLVNARLHGLAHLFDVAQCDNISCIRPTRSPVLIVYNTPYLPVNDEGLEALAWSGGLLETLRTINMASSYAKPCLVVCFSSLSGPEDKVLEALRASGFSVVCKLVEHVFFEDIVSVAACKP
jgi:methylase of polypeptide subunit release factors